MGVLRKVSNELYEKGYKEDIIDNYINDKNIQLEMDDNSYTFYFNGNIMFSIKLFPQLNDIINNASNNIIQWFESKIKNVQESKNMAKKQLIRLTEGDLHKIIKESIERIISEAELNEISADLAHRAMNAAYDKRDRGINTPEWGKRNKQAQKFRQYYGKAFKDEHNQDGNIFQGNTMALTWDDKLSDGTPVSFHFAGAFEGKTENQRILCSWEQLVSNKQLQQFFCQMSPKSAAMVAKWWKQNHIYPKNPDYGKEGFDPSFWSQYDTNAFKGRNYTFNGLG